MKLDRYSTQSIDEHDVKLVLQALTSDTLTQGEFLSQFENALRTRCQSDFAIATSSATAALHLYMLANNIGPGCRVWVPAITFAATSNVALLNGAEVEFVDIDIDTFNISIAKLEAKLRTQPPPDLVIAVHMAGMPCDMHGLDDLAKKFGFQILEDASHALGSKIGTDPVGACKQSHACVFSFHPVKPISTGEGGALVTNNRNLADKVRLLRSHGITRDDSLFEKSIGENPTWYYEQISLGLNYRMSEINAALGLSQLNKLERFIEARHQLSRVYRDQLEALDIGTFQSEGLDMVSSHHLEVLRLNDPKVRDELYETLKLNRVGCNVHYIPVYKHPYYSRLKDWPFLENAELYYKTALSLPLHQKLSKTEVKAVCDLIAS